jgi:hypothetical protein
MGEELAEHECMVRLGVFLRQSDILVHVEGNNMLESCPASVPIARDGFGDTYESLPSLTSRMRDL